MENIRITLDRLVRSTVELNGRMRDLYQRNLQRVHYLFTMKQISQVFRNLCLSLNSESSIDDLLCLWRHEILWIYGKRLSNPIDEQRFEQVYQTIIKKNFLNLINEQQILLDKNEFFSNLQLTESGELFEQGASSSTSTSFVFVPGMVIAGLTRDQFNAPTDLYCRIDDRSKVEHLIRTALIEFNKEKPKIDFPLYPVSCTASRVERRCFLSIFSVTWN